MKITLQDLKHVVFFFVMILAPLIAILIWTVTFVGRMPFINLLVGTVGGWSIYFVIIGFYLLSQQRIQKWRLRRLGRQETLNSRQSLTKSPS